MIVIKSFGGLGNQMFQYVFYRYLLLDNDDTYFDTSDFYIHNHHYGFELTKVFDLDFKKISNKELRTIRFDNSTFFYRLLYKIFNIDIIKKTEFVEVLGTTFINRAKYKKDIYFKGYWQNKKYLEQFDKDIFIFKNNLVGKNLEMINKYKDKETVSIHIRACDYINNSTLGKVCDREYYSKAIDIIEKRVNNCTFIVFSDDIEYAKSIMSGKKVEYVDWNKDEDSYKDMQLMSCCKHNIIANSTFSWWAAWINTNKNKIVIMPSIWNKTESYNPLIVDGWITI